MIKEYVFDQLVNNLDDHIGLFAYSFYKYEKAELARSMRAAGKTEPEIDLATERHHENVSANKHQREKFRDQSQQFFVYYEESIFREISQHYEVRRNDAEAAHKKEINESHANYQKQIEILKRQHDAQLKKLDRNHKKALEIRIKDENEIRTNWLKKVEAQKVSELGKAKAFGTWLLSGIPGAIATILLTVAIMSIVLMLKTTTEDKRKYLQDSALEVVDTLIPQPNKNNPNITK